MSQSDFRFFESGATGWQLIPQTTIPNPTSVPIKTPIKSTMKVHPLADGSEAIVIPETKYIKEPVQFSWYFQSGMTLLNKMRNLACNNTPFKIQGHQPDEEWTGRITLHEDTKKLWGRHDRVDVVITLKPTND